MRIVPVNTITKEITLAKTIYNSSGNVLLRKGTLITQSLLDKIKAAEVTTIYIDDGYCTEEIEDIIKPELKHKAVHTIKETFKTIQNDIQKSMQSELKLNDRLKAKLMSKYVENLNNITEAIIEDILKSHQLMVNVTDIKHIGDYEYEHALNVAVLSLIMGIELRMNKHDLYTLFIGAMLHDIGKVFIDKNLLNLGNKMDAEAYELYKEHPKKGYEYIKDNRGFSPTSNIVVLQHHEHYDGGGFPSGTSGDHIHKNARIVSICNTYDKMTSDSINSPAVAANEAIEFIMGNAGSIFDFDLVNLFVRKINPYPAGTLVDLSNETTAVVIDTNLDYPLRPIVQVLQVRNKLVIRKEIYDLLEVTDLTIKRIRYRDPVHEEE